MKFCKLSSMGCLVGGCVLNLMIFFIWIKVCFLLFLSFAEPSLWNWLPGEGFSDCVPFSVMLRVLGLWACPGRTNSRGKNTDCSCSQLFTHWSQFQQTVEKQTLFLPVFPSAPRHPEEKIICFLQSLKHLSICEMLNSKQLTGFLKNHLEHVGGSGVAYFCRLSGVHTSSSYNPSGSSKVPVNRKGNVTVPACSLLLASQKTSWDTGMWRLRTWQGWDTPLFWFESSWYSLLWIHRNSNHGSTSYSACISHLTKWGF